MMRTFCVISWLALLGGAVYAGTPFAPADVAAWRTVEDPRISADGRAVVYVKRSNGRANLRVIPAAAGPIGQSWDMPFDPRKDVLTDGPWQDRSPRWSPDGARIAFLSDRDEGRSIRVAAMTGGAQTSISTGDYSPLALAWSPDGHSIAFTAMVTPRATTNSWAPPELLGLLRAAPPAVELFTVALDGGAPRQISHGGFAWRGEPAWLPAGDVLLDAAAGAGEAAQIYAVRAADGEARRLTDGPGDNEDPLPSPDGARIAWICAPGAPAFYAVHKVCVMGQNGDHRKVLGGLLDRDARHLQWSADSRTVYFLADDHGATHVYAARADGTVRQASDGAERLDWLSLADNGRAVAVRSTATEAGELVAFATDLPGGMTTLAAPNQALLHERAMGAIEEIAFESAGNTVQGWLIRPPGVELTQPVPLIVEVPGEPRTMFGYEFPLDAHILAASGYAVLRLNPRGSPGYGEVFGNLLATRLPGDDFDDAMRGVEAAIAKGGIDSKRIGLIGGAVAAWALGHTNRFAAVVARRPIVDWTSAVALDRDGWRRAAWMGGMPWEQAQRYVDRSPLYAAASFAAPTLIIGGDVQSDELYFALQARKVASALLAPGAADDARSHAAELAGVIAWFDRWLKPSAARHP
jgi:acylaminoacyl-peptidase